MQCSGDLCNKTPLAKHSQRAFKKQFKSYIYIQFTYLVYVYGVDVISNTMIANLTHFTTQRMPNKDNQHVGIIDIILHNSLYRCQGSCYSPVDVCSCSLVRNCCHQENSPHGRQAQPLMYNKKHSRRGKFIANNEWALMIFHNQILSLQTQVCT